jgi:hypothetical protein
MFEPAIGRVSTPRASRNSIMVARSKGAERRIRMENPNALWRVPGRSQLQHEEIVELRERVDPPRMVPARSPR